MHNKIDMVKAKPLTAEQIDAILRFLHAFKKMGFKLTSPYYPRSPGKLEHCHASVKGERFRREALTSVDAARRVVASCVAHYNDVRLQSALATRKPCRKAKPLAPAVRDTALKLLAGEK